LSNICSKFKRFVHYRPEFIAIFLHYQYIIISLEKVKIMNFVYNVRINMQLKKEDLKYFLESIPGLKETIQKKNLEIEDIVETMMNFFYDRNIVLDNTLNALERKIFYMIEELGFMESTTETIPLGPGKYWRIHYWELKDNKIKEYVDHLKKTKKLNNNELYEAIFDTIKKQD